MATRTEIPSNLQAADQADTESLTSYPGRRLVFDIAVSAVNLQPIDGGSTPSGESVDYVWGN